MEIPVNIQQMIDEVIRTTNPVIRSNYVQSLDNIRLEIEKALRIVRGRVR